MTKSDVLTAAEAAAFRPAPEIVRYVFREGRSGPDTSRPLRVLDWGCGRGRFVLSMLQQGVDCYGVDVDRHVVANAEVAFRAAGQDPAHRLRIVGEGQHTGFPDGYFDVVVSDNVLEHVADLDGAIAEMARVTREGGWGFHLFPARFTLREGHLFMPFVHWLPKNGLRRVAIRLCVVCGLEPHWAETRTMTAAEKTEIYFRYSCDKTYYRSPTEVLKACGRYSFLAHLVAHQHPRIMRHRVLRELAGGRFGGVVSRVLSEFKAMELLLERVAS